MVIRFTPRRLLPMLLAAALPVLGIQLCAASQTSAAPTAQYDLWIRHGTVVDGTGRAPFAADVLTRGDTIAFVGHADERVVKAHRTIDAQGKLVTPGFIDAHSHGDPLRRPFVNFLEQGITTVLLGQDGNTAGFETEGVPPSLKEWMRRIDAHGSEVNIATLSGQATLRGLIGVDDSPVPTAAQLAAMQKILRDDLDAGSFGMSFGLEYEPGRYSQVAEQKALGDLVGGYGGIVMSHMRSEDSDKIAGAIDELLQINAHVHVSHIKIVAGQKAEEAQKVLAQLARARSPGREVTADVYPYLASASTLVFLYPEWAKREDDYKQAVNSRRAELEAHIIKRVEARNGPKAILFTSGPYAGLTLADIAKRLRKPYVKVIIDDIGYEGPQQAHFLMNAAVHDQFIEADQICFSTDGAPNARHPRSYGAFIKVLEDYVGPAPKMSLERAVYKMSGLAAHIIGIADRGTLAVGKKADLLVLSPNELHSRATYTEPTLQPSGIDAIVVNGAVAFENGRVDSKLHGRILRRTPTAARAAVVR